MSSERGKNPNGSMGGINPCEKQMFTGGYKSIKNCIFAGVKDDTGSKNVKVIHEFTMKFMNDSRNFHTVTLEQCAGFMIDKLITIPGLKVTQTNKNKRKKVNE
jgi:hypothetical protein